MSVQQRTLTLNGQRFTLSYPAGQSPDFVLQEIFGKQVYPFLPFVRERPGVILDVGAHLGCASLWFRLLYPQHPILAFEPDPVTFDCLRQNTAPLTNIRLFNFGFHERAGVGRLYQGQVSGATNSLSASVHNQAAYHEVHLRRLAEVLQEEGLPHIALLKLDTEGAEVPILRDIAFHLAEVDVLMLEYHSETDRREIDQLLAPQYMLGAAQASWPLLHRGTLVYVHQNLINADLNRLAIPRPTL